MLRLFGLLFCILLTLVFPFLAYEMNDVIIVDSIVSTSVFFVIIIALFPESNFNKKTADIRYTMKYWTRWTRYANG